MVSAQMAQALRIEPRPVAPAGDHDPHARHTPVVHVPPLYRLAPSGHASRKEASTPADATTRAEDGAHDRPTLPTVVTVPPAARRSRPPAYATPTAVTSLPLPLVVPGRVSRQRSRLGALVLGVAVGVGLALLTGKLFERGLDALRVHPVPAAHPR
jgi:hypothetical protein